MKARTLFSAFLVVGWLTAVKAGPEIYDPLEAYKRQNTLSVRPIRETVTAGGTTESARFTYDGNLLSRVDYFGHKDIPAGYSLFEYDKGMLVHEQLFDGAGKLTEDIRYQYKQGRLEKSLIHDVRGAAKIEWQYMYDKEGYLVAGKRLIAGKSTESFKLVRTTGGVTQNIYNAKGELTSRVESIIEKGVLLSRMKTGLVGARYAEYKYDDKKLLIEIIYHDTVRGEKTFVKKHHFDYSLQRDAGRQVGAGGQDALGAGARDLPKTALR